MGHDHSHDDPQTYYVEQLCTIGIAGALGGIAFMLYERGLLWFVSDKVKPWVLAGGIALLVLVAIRAVVVWMQAGRLRAADHDHDHHHHHDHGHDHSHSCGHEHEHALQTSLPVHSHGSACDHDHDHDHAHDHTHDHAHDDYGHSHGWAPWRYVILLLPVVLYFLDLPNESMAGADKRDAVNVQDINVKGLAGGGPANGKAISVSFADLQRAPNTPEGREFYEGKTIRIKGQFLPGNDQMFTLVRYKMNCCARDAVALKAVIWVDRSPGDTQEKNRLHPTAFHRKDGGGGEWVEVEGQVHFQQEADGSWMTIVVLRPDDKHILFDPKGEDAGALIKIVKADSNYFLS